MFNKKMNEPGSPQSSQPSNPSAQQQRPPEAAKPNPAGNPPSAAPAPSSPGAATVLAEGSRFVGSANVAGTLRVEGEAEGDLKAVENFVVGKTGQVEANVTTRRAILNGHFRGKIDAGDRVELQAGSDVKADISARNMVMEDGVQFQGNCKIGS